MNKAVELYHDKARKWAYVLSFIPTLEAVFLSGSLATGKAHRESDIDFFILTRPGTIWFTRFWVFLCLKVCGQLAKPHNHAGRICPNHFITTDGLELQEQNDYSAQMFTQNIALYDPRGLMLEFAKANNPWVKSFGYDFAIPHRTQRKRSICKSMLGLVGVLLEPLFRMPQKWKIERQYRHKTRGEGIVLTDKELRFHPVRKSQLPSL